MRKEKSKVIFEVLTVIITFLLTLSVYFDFEHSNCVRNADQTRITNITPLYQELNFAWSNFHFIYTNLNVLNHTKLDYAVSGGQCVVTFNNDLPNECMKDWREWPLNTQSKINELEQNLSEMLSSCDVWGSRTKITMCAALILSLFVTVFGGLIYRSYKQ